MPSPSLLELAQWGGGGSCTNPQHPTVLIGCVYLDPTDKTGADADISWVRDEYVGSPAGAALDELVPAWIDRDWPLSAPRYVGRDLTWTQWLAIPRKGD